MSLSFFKKLLGKKPQFQASFRTDTELLLKNRLRRSLDLPPFGKQEKQSLWGPVFMGIFALLVLLMPAGKIHAAAYITLDAFSGHAVPVQVSGGGWTPGETVSLYLGSPSGSAVATAHVGDDSFFPATSVAVPANTPQGPIRIYGTGSVSGLTQDNSYYVIPFDPSITPTSSENTPGSTVTLSGSGFAPNETVNFSLSGATGSAVADATGSFTNGHLVIPDVPSLTYQLHATGAQSGAGAIYYFWVGAFYPSVSPSVYYLLPEQALSFSGSGFRAGENIDVTAGSSATVLSTIAANSSGSFTDAGTFTVSLSLAGGVRTFHLHGRTSGLNASTMVTVDQLNGSIYPSTYFVNPGNTVSFSGSGFAPSETVQVTVDSGTVPLTTFSATAAGSFANLGTVTVPFNFAGTTHTYHVTGQHSGTGGSVDILVGGFYPSITPSAWYFTPGQSFTVSGSGFASGEQISISSTGASPVNITAAADGSFLTAGPFAAPFAGGNVHIVATGQLSGATVSQDISLGGLYPQITPSAYYIPSGGQITFSGSGFAPGENITMSTGSTTLATITGDSSGGFTGQVVTVPFGADRTITYSFTGAHSGAVGTISITAAGLHPNVDADNYYVTPGSVVHVHGTGFSPNEPVTITAGSANASTTADATGETPSAPIILPMNLTGSVQITMTGSLSHASNFTTITLAPFTAQIAPSTYWTFPGSTFTLSGTGFSGGENVQIKLNNNSVGTASSTTSGTFSFGPISIPYNATAAHVTAQGATSGATASVDIGLGQLSPGITLSTYYDKGGTPLTVTGMGFGANEVVDVTFEGATIGNSTTTGSGDFTLATMVPYGPAGSKTIQARGRSSGAMSQANFTQPQVYVSVQLGAYAGAPGSSITFIGSGFMPNEPVTISTDRTSGTVYTFNADSSGNFTDSGYNVPNTFTGGPLLLTITGTHSFVSKGINYYVTGP